MIIYQILYVVIFFFLVYVYTKKKWASLVFLYILLVPMGQTLPDNAIIIPGIGIVDFITILLILKYFQVYKKITKYPSKLHRLAVFLSFFFIVIGLNSITIYIASRLIDFSYTANILLDGIIKSSSENIGTLIVTLGSLTLKWLFLYALYRKRIFLKI